MTVASSYDYGKPRPALIMQAEAYAEYRCAMACGHL